MKHVPRLFALSALIGGLGATMNASAQLGVFERLVMPGPVMEGHSEYENDCASCHVEFDRDSQRLLCLGCHEEIAEDLETMTGFHSLSPEAADRECADCHTDHEGRDADIVGLDTATFDHRLTDFQLRDSHLDVPCESCHLPARTYHEAAEQCVACHAEDDQHAGNLGETCSDCHSETTWADASFDHQAETGFQLLGKHAENACADCHIDQQYQNTSTECVGCHRDDDAHAGDNGAECQGCHSPNDWAESLFDHLSATGFALLGSHAGIECDSCHQGNKFAQSPATNCHGCHEDDDAHAGVNGTVCEDCHSATEWTDVSFDHGRDTQFALHDAHAELDCENCHQRPVAVALPETTCFACHDDDDPHDGQLGERCENCHGEIGFTVGVRFDHGLTRFPLLGRHNEIECEDCHESHAFLDAPEQCVDCHLDDDVHEDRLGADCASCHAPADWGSWFFDHNTQTEFQLDGAHAGLACRSCHREPLAGASISLEADCRSCHRGDDVHRDAFGQDCQQCHTTESFGALRAVR